MHWKTLAVDTNSSRHACDLQSGLTSCSSSVEFDGGLAINFLGTVRKRFPSLLALLNKGHTFFFYLIALNVGCSPKS